LINTVAFPLKKRPEDYFTGACVGYLAFKTKRIKISSGDSIKISICLKDYKKTMVD